MLDFGFAFNHEIRAELAARMRAQRLIKGLKQVEPAERAGVNVSTVKLFEKSGGTTFDNFVRMVMGPGLVEGQSLFVIRIRTIADMERDARSKRLRAPCKPRP